MFITVLSGTDTYGRVKKVAGTPIVTKFVMLQALPIYPLESYYFLGFGTSKVAGIPFIAETRTMSIQGIRLASIDKTSAAIAYARGLFGALTIVGFFVIVPGIMFLRGDRLDEFATIAMRGLLSAFVIGVLGGILTYIVPLMSRRERFIRQFCAELLGASVDPARVSAETSEDIANFVKQRYGTDIDSRIQCLSTLIDCRANIARSVDRDGMEIKTDQLIERLTSFEQTTT